MLDPIHPLRRLVIRNFKSICETEVGLAPLTVLAGINSSGKSSLLHAILMVSQAVETGGVDTSFPLNGHRLSLGDFERARHAQSHGQPIVIQMEGDPGVSRRSRMYRPTEENSAVRFSLTLEGSPDEAKGSTSIIESSLELLEASDEAYFRGQAAVLTPTQKKSIQDFGFAVHRRQGTLKDFRGRLADSGVTGVTRVDTETLGLMHAGGIPTGTFVPMHKSQDAARRWTETRLDFGRFGRMRGAPAESWASKSGQAEAVIDEIAALAVEEIQTQSQEQDEAPSKPRDRDLPHDLIRRIRHTALRDPVLAEQTIHGVEEAIRERLDTIGGDWTKNVYVPTSRLGAHFQNSFRIFELGAGFAEMLSEVRYLGPLRQDPQAVYAYGSFGRDQTDIGPKGEFTAAVFHQLRERKIRAPGPPGFRDRRFLTLSEAVEAWLDYFGIPRLDIAIETHGWGVRVHDPLISQPLPLSSVGVGTSQVLPVLVSCLLAEPGTLILLEQPELHLHPALQQRLGDFLLAMAKSGRQLVVETHSEYMITRLRRRIAEDESEEQRLLSLVQLLFAERDAEGVTSYRPVHLTATGGIDGDWPKGFFDQGPEEAAALLRLAMNKR
jgi:predicted ATPase